MCTTSTLGLLFEHLYRSGTAQTGHEIVKSEVNLLTRLALALEQESAGTMLFGNVNDLCWDGGKLGFVEMLSFDLACFEDASDRRPPPWYVGLSDQFKADMAKVDRKLQGRILTAIADLTEAPLEPHGDTVKPLKGGLAGCWRFRIGDYRLIYKADAERGNVTLLAFDSRSSAYE